MDLPLWLSLQFWCHRPPHAARSGVCAPSRLDCHTSTNAGSFQRDSARWESWHRHRFRLHDRRASCPFSGAVRRSRLPGIVSFHRHSPPEGCGPSCPEMWSGVRPAAYCTQRGWRQMHRRHPIPCEGGRGMGAQGHTLPHSHFRIYHALRFPHEGITATFSVK